jgi:predicted MFS family arabinose efflux permease
VRGDRRSHAPHPADKRIIAFIVAVALWNLANSAMLPLLGQKLGMNDPPRAAMALAICIVIAQAVMIAVAPLAGRLAERGRKWLYLIAFVLVPVRAVAFAFIDDRETLMALQIVDGLGAGVYGVLTILMMADLGKGTGHFNLLQGTTYTVIALGVAASNVLAGVLVSSFGYAVAFCTLAGVGTVASIYFVLFVPETNPGQEAPAGLSAAAIHAGPRRSACGTPA